MAISDYRKPAQLVRTEHPLNTEPSPEALARELVTPVEVFYVRTHGTVPDIDPSDYRLSIEGNVSRPVRYTLRDLQTGFEKVTMMAALQCAGNRRNEMTAVAPIPGEVAWAAQAVGNAVWAGVRLRDVLQAAGVDARSSGHVAFMGADEIEKDGHAIGFGASIGIDKAMSAEPLLAYEMNGMPLERIHGFPVRGLVPGYIGARSVKWLTTVCVQDKPSVNFYQARSYKRFAPSVISATANWEQTAPLEDVRINSVICRPSDGDSVAAGPVRVCGYAIGDGGAAIDRVEVSCDAGRSWVTADLLGKSEPWRWNLWETRFELDAGVYDLAVRARDARGAEQPADGRDLWNFKGYEWNAWHRVRITATRNEP